jgi:hypothetical protein
MRNSLGEHRELRRAEQIVKVGKSRRQVFLVGSLHKKIRLLYGLQRWPPAPAVGSAKAHAVIRRLTAEADP